MPIFNKIWDPITPNPRETYTDTKNEAKKPERLANTQTNIIELSQQYSEALQHENNRHELAHIGSQLGKYMIKYWIMLERLGKDHNNNQSKLDRDQQRVENALAKLDNLGAGRSFSGFAAELAVMKVIQNGKKDFWTATK